MNRGLPLLSRHSEMLGRAVGTMPSHQVGLGKKSTCRRNQNNEGTLPLRSIDVANAASHRFAESSLSLQEFLLVRRHRTARLFGPRFIERLRSLDCVETVPDQLVRKA